LRVLVRRQIRQVLLIILWWRVLVVVLVVRNRPVVAVRADFVAPLQIRVVAAV
jgi:hypothetical protein